MREHTFHDIDTVIDEVHDLFDTWALTSDSEELIERYGLYIMKLAVHEWIANLVQHASFETNEPMIRLVITRRGEGLHCLVEDNSAGFDFNSQIDEQTKLLNQPIPSERGRGLLMMLAFSEDFVYETSSDGLQHLEFVVRPPVDTHEVPAFFPSRDDSDPTP